MVIRVEVIVPLESIVAVAVAVVPIPTDIPVVGIPIEIEGATL